MQSSSIFQVTAFLLFLSFLLVFLHLSDLKKKKKTNLLKHSFETALSVHYGVKKRQQSLFISLHLRLHFFLSPQNRLRYITIYSYLAPFSPAFLKSAKTSLFNLRQNIGKETIFEFPGKICLLVSQAAVEYLKMVSLELISHCEILRDANSVCMSFSFFHFFLGLRLLFHLFKSFQIQLIWKTGCLLIGMINLIPVKVTSKRFNDVIS